MATKGEVIIDQRALAVTRAIGLIAPLFFLGYGLLVAGGHIASDNYHSPTVLWLICAAWVVLGLQQSVWPSRTIQRITINTVAYHVLAAAYILFVSGFAVAFLSGWALLYLACYIYFGATGVAFSVLSFIAVMMIDVALSERPFMLVLPSLTAVIATILVGLAAISLNRVTESDREAVIKSKRSAALQHNRLLTLINNLADPIVSTDATGKITVYNAAVLGLFDTNENLNGKLLDDVFKLYDNSHKRHRLLTMLKAAKAVTINDSLVAHIGGETMRVELTYSPIRGSLGGGTKNSGGYVVIIRDVTKTKSLEEERDEFISVVSHELRTPIAVTEAAIDNARVVFAKNAKDTKAVGENLSLAHDQVLFLSNMVNDLSTLSRAERGAGDTPEVIDVAALAHSLHAEYTAQAEEKGIAFNLSMHGTVGSVLASRLYVHELLQNFITNAIKYTKKGRVDLVITKKNGVVTFAVKDSGIGISKSDQVKIFEKFYRSEDYRTRETGGTGLGLYVSQKLARKLGCSIEVSSRLNHGSTFSISLPIDTTQSSSAK